MKSPHSFHIPVMGTGFTLDTPIKVAKYGISSVISLVDDTLIEQMRAFYSKKNALPYTAITKNDVDYRAKRITAYLNLLDVIVARDFKKLQESEFVSGSEITTYFELLPDTSPLKKSYRDMCAATDPMRIRELQAQLRRDIVPGSIDVNIMTKLDRTNFDEAGTPLSAEFSDALSALRGYAQSTLTSAIVFSAGINRRLYTYVEKFEDFYATASGFIKKKIVLKVSDYRSALIQGRFFAKKGLWISEFRIESGLNCGGHVFATEGYLMGPIMQEFKDKKDELIASLKDLYDEALRTQKREASPHTPATRITAQGGIGTAREDQFLLSYYAVDGTGWGSPFLLVPEATSLDDETRQKLADAGVDDLFVSNVSPMGVPFNNFRTSASELAKQARINAGTPGSPCFKGHIKLNTELTQLPICVASRQYQKLKIEQLESQKVSPQAYADAVSAVTDKACICHELGGGILIANGLATKETCPPAVCPGPNLAYFSKIMSLREMIDHIYGRANHLNDTWRPHMLIKELRMYIDHFIVEVKKCRVQPTENQVEMLREFKTNLVQGISYYQELFPKMVEESAECRQKAVDELRTFSSRLEKFIAEHADMLVGLVTE